MQNEIVRTYAKRIKGQHTATAFNALALAVKNLQNCTTFVLRQVLSSYEDNVLKPTLHEEQLKVLKLADECVAIVNETQAPKLEKKRLDLAQEISNALAAGTEPPKHKEFKPLGYFKDRPSAKKKEEDAAIEVEPRLPQHTPELASPWDILNLSLIDKIMQGYLDDKGQRPYAVVPAAVAQQAIAQVLTHFKSWLTALKTYKKNPANFTGRPKMPGYAEKNALAAVKFPYAQTHGRLIGIKGKTLFEDFAKTLPLSAEARQAYADFDVDEIVEEAMWRSGEPNATAKEIRIVPKKTGVVVEVVLGWSVEIDDASPLGKALLLQQQDKAYNKLSLSDIGKKLLGKLKLEVIPNSAGADLGLNNMLSLAFTNGAKSKVISNGRFESRVKRFDEQIDALQSSLACERQRELQSAWDLEVEAQKMFGPVLPFRCITAAQLQELRMLQAAVYQNKELLKLRLLREQWISDALHKVSINVVELLLKEGVKVLVVGKNIGWKNGMGLGKQTNRRSLGTAHAVLIEKLTYKCLENGILVVETEESYTSKTSFAKNEPLKSYAKTEKGEKEKEVKNAVGDEDSHDKAPVERDEARPNAGLRCAVKESKSPTKHAFVTKGLTGRWARIHADVNAAFNILRKLYTQFSRHTGLSSSFDLLGLSHKGLDHLYIRA